MAAQLLRALTPARLIAGDINDAKLAHARELGAEHVINARNATAAEEIRDLVGLGGGVVHYAANSPPYGAQVTIPYWGSRAELMEVIALSQSGKIKAKVETFKLEQANEVYQRLREGKFQGPAAPQP